MTLVSKSLSSLGSRSRLGSRLVVVAAAFAVCLIGGAGVVSAESQATKPVLHFGLAGDLNNPNPALAGAGQASITYFGLAYAPLIHINVDGSFSPGLATSWRYIKTSAGPNKAFELTLRHNARFSSGQPVTAAAVASWLSYFSTATGGQFITLLGPKPVFSAVGKWTVRIQMQIPNPSLPYLLSELRNWGFVAAPQASATPSLFTGGTYGAGPYVLVPSQSVTGDHYTFVPNRYYYNQKAIKYSEIDVKVIPDPNSLLAALKSGQIDIGRGSAETAPAAKAAGFKVASSPDDTDFVGLDRTGVLPESKPLTDVRVRQALNYAIDRRTIVTSVVGGGSPTSEMLTSNGTDPKLKNAYPYNPTKAKSLLAAAGYANGFSLNLLYSPILYPNGTDLAQVIASEWGAIGVKVTLTSAATVGEYLQDLSSKRFSAFIGTSGLLPMTTWAHTTLLPGGVYNPFGVVDSVIAKAYYASLGAGKPLKYWLKIDRQMVSGAYFVPLFGEIGYTYYNKKVSGVLVSEVTTSLTIPIEWHPTGR